jgi:hypothetical protein
MKVRSIVGRLRRRTRSQRNVTPSTGPSFVASLDDTEQAVVAEAQPFSMTSPERLVANMDAVAYVVRRDIPGAFVECGVWRGGSVLVMIRALQRLGVVDRDLYLFDTFEGMTEPTEAETSRFAAPALHEWDAATAEGKRAWDTYFGPDKFNLDGVKALMRDTGYPQDRIHVVAGRVEATVPDEAPDSIALLRLDTDWYESTRHELLHLYPRLSNGGVLIIDDYGHWDGCRRAVDEYFSAASPAPLLARVDYTGRIAIKY